MDPFSLTCGVAGLIGLAQVVVERGFSYISTAKDTREDIRNLICEVATLSSILLALVPVVDELGKSGCGTGITKHEQISDCERILQQLSDLLQKINPAPHANQISTPGAKKPSKFEMVKESIGNAVKMAKWPLKKDETIGLLDRLQKHKTTFILTLSADSTAKLMDVLDEAKVTNRVLVDVRSEQDRVAEEKIEAARVATLCWLFPDDPAKKHEDILQKRHEGTGNWFFDTEEFKSWYHEPSWLFCHGKPGVGKTVLTSTVIDYMIRNPPATDGDIGIAYIYCGFKDRDGQTPAKIFASILRQLGFQKPVLPSEIQSLDQDYKKKGRAPPLSDLFKATVSLATRFASVFVFFDALDEYDEVTRPELLSRIAALMKTNIRGFVTSRPHDSNIQKTFKEVVEMELSTRPEDIELFVRSRLSTRSLAVDLVEKVVSRVLENADGVFLLAAFQIEFIIAKKRPRDVKNCLDNLPLGLEGTYDNIIHQINGQDPDNRQLALNALSWISHASRPLNPTEFCIAMSIVEGDTAIEDDDILDELDLVHICGGLVTIDELSQTVRFVHYTVQEYLEKTPVVPCGPVVHAVMAKSCLTYLSFEAFDNEPNYDSEDVDEEFFLDRRTETHFYTYASVNWGYHTKLSEEEDSVLEMICRFSKTGYCVESAITEYCCCMDGEFVDGLNIFAIAAVVGLPRLTQALIQLGSPGVDHRDDQGRSALSHAAENGQLAVVELLAGRDDVETDSKNEWGNSPLSYAAEYGHLAVVELLAGRNDVETDSRDKWGQSPLCYAAMCGHLAVVELLAGRDDVDADSRDQSGKSPLSNAAMCGRLAVVELLAGMDDVDADSRDGTGKSPLSYAAKNAHLAVVELLVGRVDVKADSRDKSGQSPLCYAAMCGHLAVVELLVGRDDVDADSRDQSGKSPLSYAAKCGHLAVVEVLAGRADVDADPMDQTGKSPLSYAAMYGHPAVVELLAGRDDVEADSRDQSGKSPLSHAAQTGRLAVVELLAGRDDVEADSRDRKGRSPLSYAAMYGHLAVVELLADRDDVEADSRDQTGKSPLSYAAEKGHLEVVELLAGRDDVEADSSDQSGKSPLSYAAKDKRLAVVELLAGRDDVQDL